MTDDRRPVALVVVSAPPRLRDAAGRDRWTVRAVNAWVRESLPPLLAAGDDRGACSMSAAASSRSGR